MGELKIGSADGFEFEHERRKVGANGIIIFMSKIFIGVFLTL